MTSVIDSVAEFKSRAVELGISAQLIDDMALKGWSTFATFAHSSGYTPQQPDDKVFVEQVLDPLLGGPGSAAADPRAPAVRRLLYEAWTLCTAELRRRVEMAPQDRPRRLPLQERHARFERLQAKLVGLALVDDLEPSHGLVDLACQQVDEGSIAYIPWSACTTRAQEVHGCKRTKEWRADKDGVLREHSATETATAEIGNELKLKYALQRRGLALDIAGILPFAEHERIIAHMFQELLRDPLPGFAKTSLLQVERADREVFRLLAESTRAGLQPTANGYSVASGVVDLILQNTKLNFLLLQLPGKPAAQAASGASGSTQSAARPSGQKRKVELERPEAKRAKRPARGKPMMPRELAGMAARTAAGKPICFAFNMQSGCSSGKECKRGLHVCARPNCAGDHSLIHCSRP